MTRATICIGNKDDLVDGLRGDIIIGNLQVDCRSKNNNVTIEAICHC